MDVAKLVAILAGSRQPIGEIYGLDAVLTLELPPTITVATGTDAMVHAIEAYTSRHIKNPLSDALAREALSLLSRKLLRACEQGSNIEVRQAMLLGACLRTRPSRMHCLRRAGCMPNWQGLSYPM